jgi:hypothetical protein
MFEEPLALCASCRRAGPPHHGFLEGTGLSTNPILTIVALLLCVETVQDSCAG